MHTEKIHRCLKTVEKAVIDPQRDRLYRLKGHQQPLLQIRVGDQLSRAELSTLKTELDARLNQYTATVKPTTWQDRWFNTRKGTAVILAPVQLPL